jgi:hypothetical protein
MTKPQVYSINSDLINFIGILLAEKFSVKYTTPTASTVKSSRDNFSWMNWLDCLNKMMPHSLNMIVVIGIFRVP